MFNDFVEHTSRNTAQRFCVILSDDQIWTSLQVGNLDEKNTEKIQGGTTFEESISLLIYDLANDKVRILSYRFARDVTAAMLVIKNKSISLLWETNSIFM